MDHPQADLSLIPPLARELLALTVRAQENAAEDPFGNPVMSLTAKRVTGIVSRGGSIMGG